MSSGEQQHGERVLGEGARGVAAVGRDHAGEERHEGGAEGALGKERAEQVGQAKGDEERIGDRACAQTRRRSACRG